MSEKQISAREGNASSCGDYGTVQLGLSGLSELLALWGQCPSVSHLLWLSYMAQHCEHPSSSGLAACPLPIHV